MIAATVLEPESQVRRISDALHQQAVSDPVAAEVLPLISEICAMVGITLEDFTQSRAYQEIFGLGEATVTLRLLARRCGPLSEATTARIEALPLAQLEALAEALLDFRVPADLAAWLTAHS